MTGLPFETEPVPASEPRFSRTTKAAAGVVGGLLVVGGMAAGAIEVFGNGSHHGAVAEAANGPQANCGTFDFANAAANTSKYGTEAFFEHDTSVTGNDDVQRYVDAMFDKDGPLAGGGDEGSMAFIDALVTEPAQDHAVFDANRSVASAFDAKMNAYNSANGVDLITKTDAENLDKKGDSCETYQVVSQVASWNTAWARPGATVIRFTPVRNEKNQIVGMEAKNYSVKGILSGVELKITDSTKKYDDFGDVLIDPSTGFTYERGVLKQAEQSDQHKLHPTTKPLPSTSPSPENNQNSNQQNNQNQGQQTTGKNGGGVQTGNQGCGTSGKANCGGGSGTNTGNKGPQGPGNGPQGPGNSPSASPTPSKTSSPSPSNSPSPSPSRTPSSSPSPSPSPSESHTKDPNPNPSPTDCSDPFDPTCH